MTKWAGTRQRDDLKTCPFCGTKAIHQIRLADSDTDMQHRILCGNPFCYMEVRTPPCASEHYAVDLWEERSQK